jgi:hypothetical protein
MKRLQGSTDQEKSATGKKPPEVKGPEDDGCRCKEVSKKTMPEMLRLMLDDLVFWKRKK